MRHLFAHRVANLTKKILELYVLELEKKMV